MSILSTLTENSNCAFLLLSWWETLIRLSSNRLLSFLLYPYFFYFALKCIATNTVCVYMCIYTNMHIYLPLRIYRYQRTASDIDFHFLPYLKESISVHLCTFQIPWFSSFQGLSCFCLPSNQALGLQMYILLHLSFMWVGGSRWKSSPPKSLNVYFLKNDPKLNLTSHLSDLEREHHIYNQ